MARLAWAIEGTATLGQPAPAWFETTADDPEPGQARWAVEQGATHVIAMGGDGTVMGAAESLVHTEISLGIVPGGTGNLLARNLGIPLDPRRALEDLKRRDGWGAYVLQGAKHIRQQQMYGRTALIANVGMLVAGLGLIPEARP